MFRSCHIEITTAPLPGRDHLFSLSRGRILARYPLEYSIGFHLLVVLK